MNGLNFMNFSFLSFNMKITDRQRDSGQEAPWDNKHHIVEFLSSNSVTAYQ